MKIIKINYLTYYFLILNFLCGYIKNALIIFLIVLVHELGHFFIAKINKYKVKEIMLYPFGGITKISKDLNSDLLKDFFLAIFGFIFQIILFYIVTLFYNIGYIGNHTYNLFNEYNKLILLFNLLPIYPLDGYNIVNILFNKLFSFQKSYILSYIVSIISLLLFFVLNINYALNNLMIISFLLFKIVKYYRDKKAIYNKFLLERYLNNYDYKKIINTKNKTLEDLQINKLFYFWHNKKWNSEKSVLENKYKL